MPRQPDDVHEWLSFDDPDGTTWMLDLTFLTSNWKCIWRQGCPGVLDDPAPQLEQGCCSWGAHFTEKADRKRVSKQAERLTKKQWQHKKQAERRGGPIYKTADGDWVTRRADGACIFFNRPEFPGGSGCALHRAALESGDRPLDWKPEVCWQLPLRLEQNYDDNNHLTNTLREWKTRDWGEGGHDFHWWCTDSSQAFVGGTPVYREMREELIEMIGEWTYDRLVELVERPRGSEVFLPHPSLKNRA